MVGRAKRQDLQECIRLLPVYCAEYRSKFGVLPFTGSPDLLSRETIDDDQAAWLADGKEAIVGMLGFWKGENRSIESLSNWATYLRAV